MTELWAALSALPPAEWLQRSGTAYLLVNAAHIIALALLVGSIIALDLRLLGLFRSVSIAEIGPFLSRIAACGLVLAILTGAWLFSVNAATYATNTALQIKLGLIGLGVINALWLHRKDVWQRAIKGDENSAALTIHAGASLVIWLSAVVAGRWIGFL